MIAAIIFVASMVGMAQFGVYYWRATIAGIASQAISERIRAAAGITHAGINGRDFRSIMILKELSPVLRGASASFAVIRSYYAIVETVGRIIPAMASWTENEMATCSRYAAVLMDQHLERNMVCAAQVRGM
jgi:hypothetical protein